jgi:diadenosine tetraphosphate (Ap4A) HIT family hydrolase
MKIAGCDLCTNDSGTVIAAGHRLRVVLIDDENYPGFVRVIWNDHVREMSELDAASRKLLLDAVIAVEAAQRAALAPHKINLASLGNMTPHLHWHVIPRFADDMHFPSPIWGNSQRKPDPESLARRRALLGGLQVEIAARLAPLLED